ncbi:MAG: DUF445 family protein [Tissierellia bacterium]|nr:DUF445 family protein [Tissierellia bacterium]
MNYIIPVIVGGVIGYITNWIAIKMLFRPHYEKRIFNIPIPFTPGLIPKEKNRIAKSIGEAVGEYLLSPEVVVDALFKNEGSIEKVIIHYINRLKHEERTLEDLISSLNYGEFEGRKEDIKKKLASLIALNFRKDQFKDRLIKLIDEYIFIVSRDNIYGIIEGKIESFLNYLANSDEVKEELSGLLMEKLNTLSQDDRSLSEIIPEDIVNSFKDFILQNEENIVKLLKNILDNPRVKGQFKNWISDILSHNMNKLIAIFINPETISDKILSLLEEYLNKAERSKEILSFILLMVDKIFEKEISYLLGDFVKDLKEEDMSVVSEIIIKNVLKEDNQYKIIDKLKNKLEGEEENIKSYLLDLIKRELESFLNSKSFYDHILSTVDKAIESILNRSISSLIVDINEDDILSIVNFLKIIIENLIKNQLPNMVKAFNISKIVEDQINSFDVAFTEELILEIANRELKAITWLGGLLGGIIGLLTPILTMLY